METITVELNKNSYPIYIGQQLADNLAIELIDVDKIFVLTDANINKFQPGYFEKALPAVQYQTHVIDPGESMKSFNSVAEIIDAMTLFAMTRKSLIIAFGGGVIGDLAGFCASIYMRGIRYIQVPTTLLAQIDSSVGGKTGINTKLGKNLVGSFYQPQAVYIDISLLRSLPNREYLSGVGEIIKYALIEAWLLDYININYQKIRECDGTTMTFLISACCRIKAKIVSEDETETGLRKILNIGHTFGHALEATTGYQYYLHGEAVLLGVYYETRLARELKAISNDYAEEVFELIKRTNIDTSLTHIDCKKLPKLMVGDKKNSGGLISFILPVARDRYQEHQLSLHAVEDFCNNLTQGGRVND